MILPAPGGNTRVDIDINGNNYNYILHWPRTMHALSFVPTASTRARLPRSPRYTTQKQVCWKGLATVVPTLHLQRTNSQIFSRLLPTGFAFLARR
jgi:hypothetical protein